VLETFWRLILSCTVCALLSVASVDAETISPPSPVTVMPVAPLVSGALPSSTGVFGVAVSSPAANAAAKADPIGKKIGELEAAAKPELSGAELVAQINSAVFSNDPMPAGRPNPMMAKLQVMLDRAHAAPGVIDGFQGGNVGKAIAAFQAMRGLPVDGVLSASVWNALEALDARPPLVSYQITVEDAAGPFVPNMPKDYAEMAKLDRLAYRDAAELLAARYHMDEGFLRRLNPGVSFEAPGTTVMVASLGRPAKSRVTRLVADKGNKQLLGYDAAGALVVAYPATIGSDELPSPSGTHTIAAIAVNPDYWYRPDVNFKQGNNTKPLRLPPGPKNPVGTVWIGLDKPTHGIHGTPQPSKIDKTSSHGCVRLTNWNAEELSKLVQPGVPVEFRDPPSSKTVSR